MTTTREARVPRPEGETLQHTKTQFGFLAGSCAAFDTGHTAEAQRIATHLRILLYKKGTNKALLGQYGVPDKLRLFDSAGAYDLDSYSPFSLVGVHMDVTPGQLVHAVSYIPNFGDAERHQPALWAQIRALMEGRKLPRGAGFHLPIGEWWEQPVMRDAEGRTFSREKLVSYLANTDGGAHVDPGLPEDYHALSRLNSAAVHAGASGTSFALAFGEALSVEYVRDNNMAFTELGSPVPASVRQIAWELMRSIRGQFPELLRKPY